MNASFCEKKFSKCLIIDEWKVLSKILNRNHESAPIYYKLGHKYNFHIDICQIKKEKMIKKRVLSA